MSGKTLTVKKNQIIINYLQLTDTRACEDKKRCYIRNTGTLHFHFMGEY